jgi:hypothetical protein
MAVLHCASAFQNTTPDPTGFSPACPADGTAMKLKRSGSAALLHEKRKWEQKKNLKPRSQNTVGSRISLHFERFASSQPQNSMDFPAAACALHHSTASLSARSL